MKSIYAAALVALAAVVGLGLFYFTGGTGPAVVAEDPAPQQAGMSGMSGMSGMQGLAGASGSACIRYDLIDGAWLCTATNSRN